MDLLIWIFIAFVVIGIISNVKNKELKNNNISILCRLGFHKFKHIDWEEESPRAIYECKKCGQIKKVMRGV